jgi:hypothetical protein
MDRRKLAPGIACLRDLKARYVVLGDCRCRIGIRE